MKIQHRGRRESFPLNVSGRDVAADKAKRIYLTIVGEGWDAAVERFKPGFVVRETVTVGEYLALVEEVIDVRPNTLHQYRRCLRQIVAGLNGADPDDTTRFDYVNGGVDRWRETVDRVKLATLTNTRIEKWRRGYVQNHGGDPLSDRKAKTSANTVIRNASALFSDDLRRKLEVSLENPFAEIKPFKREVRGYRSHFDAEALLMMANGELMRPQDQGETETAYIRRTEAFKALLIFAFTGLRRRELDLLEWSQVNLDRALIEIRRTRNFEPKAESSLREVHLAPDAVTVLRGFRARNPEDEFVMKGHKPKAKTGWAYYRAGKTYEFLLAWLRDYKLEDGSKPFAEVQKPLHELRKEVGAILATRFGIFAAKSILGHSNIALTAGYYADQKEAVNVGLRLG